MKHERDGRLRSSRISVASFPPEHAEKSSSPPPPGATEAVSRIARRRVSSAPAHEVELGEVELVEPAPSSAARPAPRTPPRIRRRDPSEASTSGVVLGAPGHRLWIDGALAPSFQATVRCGAHVVQVGSAGTPGTVDVPCGGEVKVRRSGSAE